MIFEKNEKTFNSATEAVEQLQFLYNNSINNLQKAFQAYFQKNLVPQKFTSNRVELIYNSKQFLTGYNGVKLFVEKRLKNFTRKQAPIIAGIRRSTATSTNHQWM